MKRFEIKKDLAVDEKLVPLGRNNLTSLASFYQRGLYEDTSYPELLPEPIDTYSDFNVLYGRVNTEGSSIILAEDNLQQIVSPSGETRFVLDFVADAWNDLVAYHTKAVRLRAIKTQKSVFQRMEPKKTWESIHPLYKDHIQNMYGVFVGQFLSSPMNAEIVDFESFLRYYLDYCGKLAKKMPVTKTSFITSKYATPLTSGLIIELVDGKHDDDYAKYIGFIRDINFDFFTTACRKFGFLVDKNAPWRIIADVNSSYMREKMNSRGAEVRTTEDVFNFYYLKSIHYEIENLRSFFLQSYQLFLVQDPEVSKLKTTFKGKHTMTKICDFERKPMSREEFDEKYPAEYWIRTLCYLRATETDAPQDQREFDKTVRKAKEILQWRGLGTAVKFIDKTYGFDVRNTYKKTLNKELTNTKDHDMLLPKKPSFQY